MDPHKLAKIKKAVKNNFEESPDAYLAFEEKHGFFENLNSRLVSLMGVASGSRILDIGCGSGASSKQMLEHIPDSYVVGVDNSPSMLKAARLKYGDSNRLFFIEGDAAELSHIKSGLFDAVVYSASIFLIPDYKESLRQAKDLLNRDGVVGLTFMDGVYDDEGQNFLALADQQVNEGISLNKAVNLQELLAFFKDMFSRVRTQEENFQLSPATLAEFFSVPAMSAGLFPKFPYSERKLKVARIFSFAQDRKLLFRWILIAGEKV